MAVLSNTGIRAGASAAGGDAYQVTKSLRFAAEDTAYLNKTPSGDGNKLTWTWSGWVKRCKLGSDCTLFGAGDSSVLDSKIHFNSSDQLVCWNYTASAYKSNQITNASYRDPNAWYHIVVSCNGTTSLKIYVNNVEQALGTDTGPDGTDWYFNTASKAHNLGRHITAGSYFDGLMADVHWIDGSALDPSSFGETDATTGKWVAKKYSGSYGTNGFHLKFDGTDLGEDSAGSNDLTANNFTTSVYTISSPNLPSWDYTDGGWSKSNGNKNGTFSASSTYAQIATSALTDDTTYHFFYIQDNQDATGGWFFADVQNPTDTHPDEFSSPLIDSLGLRTTETGLGTYGTYATANSTSDGQNQITGFDSIDDRKVDVEFVVNRTVNKVWCRKVGDSTWIKGGDPTNTSSTASFMLPDGGTVYFGHVAYDGSTTANFSDEAGDPLDIDVSNDSPTTFDDDGNGTGNYCTISPLGSAGLVTQGGATPHTGAGNFTGVSSWGFDSGKWYGEFTLASKGYPGLGFTYKANPYNVGWMATQAEYWFMNESSAGHLELYPGGANTIGSSNTTLMGTKIWQLALDMDNGKGWIGYENTWYSSSWGTDGNPATGANPTFTLDTDKTWYFFLHGNSTKWKANFGQRAFQKTKPSGFLAPNTYNLPDPTIVDPSKHFKAFTWSGNSTDGRAIGSDAEFGADVIWIKQRNVDDQHNLWDTARGVDVSDTTVGFELVPNHTNDEADNANEYGYVDFATAGFTVEQGTSGSDPYTYTNKTGETYVAWTWNTGTQSSNTSVSIGGLNSSVYNTSADWSSTSTLTTPGGAFDGTDMGGSGNATYSSSGNTLTTSAITINSKLEIYTNRTHSGATDGTKVTINSTAYYDKALASTGWSEVDLSGATLPLTTSGAISIEDEGGSSSGLWGVRVDGKILVDDDVTPDSVPTRPSEYRANPTAGFSNVLYEGNATSGVTIAHGLNAKPAFGLFKARETDGYSWYVYHKKLANTHHLYLEGNYAQNDDSGAWNDTDPDSNVMTLGNATPNPNNEDMVAYIWSEVAGYSKFGYYEGNGNADGPFVYCGFKPAFVMIKKYNTTDNWLIWDNARSTYNPADVKLAANLTDVENSTSIGNTSYNMFDLVSNGFKIRSSASSGNGSGDDFVFIAFAESPFKYANAR